MALSPSFKLGLDRIDNCVRTVSKRLQQFWSKLVSRCTATADAKCATELAASSTIPSWDIVPSSSTLSIGCSPGSLVRRRLRCAVCWKPPSTGPATSSDGARLPVANSPAADGAATDGAATDDAAANGTTCAWLYNLPNATSSAVPSPCRLRLSANGRPKLQ